MDIHTIIAGHQPIKGEGSDKTEVAKPIRNKSTASFSEIPDVFFDEIIINNKLSRIDISLLMYLYRKIWCQPNLYRVYGISPMFSIIEVSKILKISIDEFYQSLKHLEGFGLLTTIRSGQYFVRRFITKENDEKFGLTYDDFEV